jgi:pimeloyl-ACP methyl ester carboxylesterase
MEVDVPSVTSVFRSPEAEAGSVEAYDAVLAHWPVPYAEQDLSTRFGPTHVVVSGQQEAMPLVLLHGQDSIATSWIHDVADLAQSFRISAVDTIGDMGKSRPTRLPGNRDDYAAWLLDVLDQLEIQRANLVGLSYGGFLALNFSLAHPARVEHLVLLAPGIPNFGPPTLRWASCGLPMLAMPSAFTVRRFIRGASTRGYSSTDPVHRQMIVGMTSLKHVSFMRPVFTDEELGQLRLPTLLLLGDHEVMYSPEQALARAGRLIPGLEGQIIANAGHMLNSDQPEIVDRLILDFLRR